MLTSSLILMLAAAPPDGGLWPARRAHEVKVQPFGAGDAVRVRVDTERLTVVREGRTEAHAFEVLTLSLPDGGSSPALDALNGTLRQDYRAESEEAAPAAKSLQDGTAAYYGEVAARLAQGQFGGDQNIAVSVQLNHGVWVQAAVCVDFIGAYPSFNCTAHQVRVDTGAAWTWLDAVPKAKQAAFLEACSRRLAPASRAQKAKSPPDPDGFTEGLFPERCTPQQLEHAAVTPQGDLVVDLGWALPHVAQALGWAFTLPRAELVRWVDPSGPLGALAEKR